MMSFLIEYAASAVKGLEEIKKERGCPLSPPSMGVIINLGNQVNDMFGANSDVPDYWGVKGVTGSYYIKKVF